MASDHKPPNDREPAFSFGVRELQLATASQERSVNIPPLETVDDNRGVDPYNTSGSFDRTRNWRRVGRR
ncbi:MAG: hypothetical protein QOF32_966 [Gammaproteobacteria bacterium]|jgi:hypothetical protein|nr:hypothetical protein [Gammaproteobacteria bacterium]